MCIAIANLKGKPLTDEQIGNCWANNGDGGGILYKEDGILKVYKNITSLTKFLKKYKEVIHNSNCLVHFRITTGGGVTIKNCHPFMVNHKLGVIHNGVIGKYSGVVADQSDTYTFNEMVLKQLPHNFLEYPFIRDSIDTAIGGSKLAFMDDQEKFTIINEKAWKAHYGEEGNWYSNDSYKQNNDFVYAGNKKVYKTDKKTPAAKPKANTYQTWDPKLGRYRYPTSVEIKARRKALSDKVKQSELKLIKKTDNKDEVLKAHKEADFDKDYANFWFSEWSEETQSYVMPSKSGDDEVLDFVERLCDLFDQVPTEMVSSWSTSKGYVVSFKDPLTGNTRATILSQAVYQLKQSFTNANIKALSPIECKEIFEVQQ